MWRSLIRISLALAVFVAPASHAVPTRFSGTLRLLGSVSTTPDPFLLLSVPIAGTADVSGTVVQIPAGAIQAAIPSIANFGGTLVNRAATFSMSGAGTGSTCPLLAMQEVCIDGGGFGGSMQLAGVTHLGQEMEVWGSDGTNPGMTASGLPRTEKARPWTQGRAQAAFYIFEIDATPFSISGTGSFLGLPGTAPGDAGFSLVTPMVVTSQATTSLNNMRAIASLRIVFTPPAVAASSAEILAVCLVLIGVFYLHRLHRSA